MDWLHSDLQTIRVNADSLTWTESDKAWNEYTKQRESYILTLFYGQIKSSIECNTCQRGKSEKFDVFSSLSLELPTENNYRGLSKNRTSIYECLKMYFDGEGINGWECPRCKGKRSACKKLELARLPAILVLHLKRFHFDMHSRQYMKNEKRVQFPLQSLDVRPYLAQSELHRHTSTTYNLYAVSNHYGEMQSGHYTAFCLNSRTSRWYKFDDKVVSQIDASEVNTSGAYILFYQIARKPQIPQRPAA